MKKLSGIIFDVDSTLASTNEIIFDSFRHVTKKYLGRASATTRFLPTTSQWIFRNELIQFLKLS